MDIEGFLPTVAAQPALTLKIRRAVVADAPFLNRFGAKAFFDTFADNPNNSREDMALYLSQTYTVERFEREIRNGDDGGALAVAGNANVVQETVSALSPQEERRAKNIFLIAEDAGGDGRFDEICICGSNGKRIVGYAKLTIDGVKAGVVLGPNTKTGRSDSGAGSDGQQLSTAVTDVMTEMASGSSLPSPSAIETSLSSRVQRMQRPCELARMYVGKDNIGTRGIGTALMEACVTLLLGKPAEGEEGEGYARGDIVWLGVAADNYPAHRFYKKHGFEFVGTHVFQFGNDTQKALLMQREL